MIIIDRHSQQMPVPSVATIGFFDGVHLGHRFLLEQVKEVANQCGLCASVITFPTHPRQVLHPEFCPLLLSSPEEKLRLLTETGLDQCILLPFTRELSNLSAYEFMRLLHDTYQVRALVIGYDHRFGCKRSETFEDYLRYGEELGMKVVKASAYTQGEDRISSSVVRRALQQGDVVKAASFLGNSYCMTGTVTDGYKVGRKIGYPTANLSIDHPDKLIPLEGVYAVAVYVNDRKYMGMLNIGHRPTLNNGSNRSIEVHILDFSGDIYHEQIRIEFLHFIRREIKFTSVDELIAQIQKDIDGVSLVSRS